MLISRRAVLAGTAAIAAGPVKGAFAQTKTIPLTISSSHPLTIPWVEPLKTVIVEQSNRKLEAMGSPNRIEWTEAFGGSLYGFNDTLESVTQQLTDMGWIGALWEPSALPLQNIMYSTPFATSTVRQAVDVMNELNQKNAAMKAEWDRQNIVFFGCCVSDGYHLFTKKPIESLADLKGLKILGAPVCAPWIEPLGATLVGTGLPAQYSQLQTGVGDGSILIATGAYPLKIHEVAPYVTLVDTGPLTFGGFGVNKDTFEGLPDDVKTVLTELGYAYSAENARLIEEKQKAALEKMEAEGAKLHKMPQDQRVAWVKAMPDLGKIWVEGNEAKGVPAREIMKAFMAAVKAHGGEPLRDWSENV
ncbi:C4-dicarboxylate ABC transporter substrate-binding protein [Rhizobiales bacterium L72]|uniref:C4-dicarboxylate ABC transporter substrate-binding protein n=1 Tax=Propylenella binzhouense TaxID=2555902 RepID=A0A964WSB1_9HYPH|nr:C4-dicarboxylate ABC transporter substrate-binding protein [Propylenella binzhouense]